MNYLTLFLIIIIAAGLILAYLFQVVSQAAVSPAKQDGRKDFMSPFLSEKRRYEVIWEDHKFLIGITAGLALGWWL